MIGNELNISDWCNATDINIGTLKKRHSHGTQSSQGTPNMVWRRSKAVPLLQFFVSASVVSYLCVFVLSLFVLHLFLLLLVLPEGCVSCSWHLRVLCLPTLDCYLCFVFLTRQWRSGFILIEEPFNANLRMDSGKNVCPNNNILEVQRAKRVTLSTFSNRPITFMMAGLQCISLQHLGHNIRKRTFGHLHPAKTQISPRICAVWSESSLGAVG